MGFGEESWCCSQQLNLGAEILDGSNESDAQMLLVWSGRAIQEKSYDMADLWLKKSIKQSGLLEERRIATKAILKCLQSPSSTNCDRKISKLKVSSGLKHATQLTAARGLIESNPSIAKKIIRGNKGGYICVLLVPAERCHQS